MKKGRVPASVPAEPHLRKLLRNAATAAAYLSYTAASDDPADFLYALRRVAEAHGGIGRIAKRANLNRQQLYKTLSGAGNPEYRTLFAILRAVGYVLHVIPKETRKLAKSRPRAARARKAGVQFAAAPTANRRIAVTPEKVTETKQLRI